MSAFAVSRLWLLAFPACNLHGVSFCGGLDRVLSDYPGCDCHLSIWQLGGERQLSCQSHILGTFYQVGQKLPL